MQPNRYDATRAGQGETLYDAGLREHFGRVYNMMALGLLVTGLVSYVTAMSPALFESIHGTWMGLIVALAPLGILFFGLTPNRVMTMSMTAVNGLYFGLTALIGLSMSYIFHAYTGESVARVFFITAATFGAMSIWGYTTKKDLSAMGSFLMMGFIGLLIAMVVNMFMGSTMLGFIISGAGVLMFTLMIAFDTQMIKSMYHPANGTDVNQRMAVMSALSLYLDVINLFQFLLSILGNRN
ncbi:MAG: Bax inhibitor-1/YccA family protein [Rhodospirillales bacterium]|nr:Bax inhibitor-1/YccA family protein [Rhodospirillales bacterium]MCB9965675.1 Bax inhibitor-1/YccA family protein [Rhodospirillales bacterium]